MVHSTLSLKGEPSAETEPSTTRGGWNHAPQTCDWSAGGGVSQEKGAISTTTFSLRRRLVQPFSRERKPALCVLDGNGGPGSHEGRLQHRHPHLNCSLGGRVWTESPQVSVEPEQVPAQLRGPTLSAGILPERPIRGQRWRNVIQWGLVSTSCNLEGPLCPQVGSRRPRLPV